ncbi:DUF1643 domain-containing protein [Methylorubrum rhodesianum]|uniref:DUF1643 domain-containing protein n=1 Tax=Methylorubrum rhodesianum TaxID=29427 RepID=UPI003745484D
MSAIISPCGLYRYRLERDLGGMLAGPTVAWIMVNPSTADATEDDHTIRKVIGFSERLGAGRIVVGNLFAFRATDIRALRTVADPVGPEADDHLRKILFGADRIIVAWGPLAKLPGPLRTRWQRFVEIAGENVRPLRCLGTAMDGHPLHPLTLGYARPLVPWSPPAPTPSTTTARGPRG